MNSRYSTSKIIKTQDGSRYYSNVVVPNIPRRDTDIYIVTTTVERMDILADQFFNDPKLWWIIANVNGITNGSLYVRENTRLRIPASGEIEELIRNYNKER